ncbi:MAG: EamA family transporter [Micromonosporaceae bacterium]|nr:EamA family transporter [Micromonosporaceae bacterium]
MSWLALTLAAAALAAAARVSHRYLLVEAADPTAYAIAYQLAAAAFIAPVAVADLRDYLPRPEHLPYYLAMLASIGCWMAFNWCSFHADRHAEVSMTSVLARTRAVWSVLVGAVLFGESILLLRVIGACLIVVGAALLVRPTAIRANRGVALALAAALVASLAHASDSFAAREVPAGILTASGFLGGGLLLSLTARSSVARVRKLLRTRARYGVLSALLASWSYWFLVQALAVGEVGQVVPIYQGNLVLVVLAGVLLLRERTDLTRKLLAAGAALAGAVLVSAAS